MVLRFCRVPAAAVLLCALPLLAQTHHPRHARYPNAPSNDPQLQLPTDQAQFCYTQDGQASGYQQFEQFDTYSQPASKGYLCIAIPPGKTFVIDYLFAEADYDAVLPAGAEWYLDTVTGGYENMIGFAASRTGAVTASPHYLLSEPLHLAVDGGSRVTLIMHTYYVNSNSAIGETPGTANLTIAGHWE